MLVITSPETLGCMTVEGYLGYEDGSATQRHELVDGWMYAMTGGTVAHERIASNLLIALGSHLAGGPCRAYKSDLKLRVGDDFYYPDVMVRCGGEEPSPKATSIDDADVVIEVLSPSTQRYDRGDKRLAYWKLPSLKHYLLVAQDEPLVEHHTTLFGQPERLTGESAVLHLDFLGLELSLGAFYR